MPNWCYTKLRVEGDPERLALFQKQYCLENGALQLNRVVPMPPDLADLGGSDLYQARLAMDGEWNEVLASPWFKDAPPEARESRKALIAWLDREHPEVMRMGRQAARNVQRYGMPTWYEWRNTHWGTKWEIPERGCRLDPVSDTVIEFHFDTAWSPIVPVLHVMTLTYRDLRFRMAYADEGGGFAGLVTADGGSYADDEDD